MTAKQSGKTTITATYTDSNGKTASATCEITVRDSAQPVHVHNIKKTTAKAATCTATGNSEYYTCAECGKYFRDSEGKNEITKDSWIIAAMGHDYVSAITAPTCTEKGYTTYTCSRCGDSYVADEVAALGHNWGEWKVIKEATKTETGIEKRICSHDISHAEIRVIEKITDDQSSSTQPADQPASGGSQTGSGVQFTDVTADTVVPTSLKAISWAVDNGIVKGYSDNTFKPEAICTREQFTIMLWRFAGEPSSDASAVNRFTDVSDFSNNTSKKAVAWAVEQSIIKGFSDGSFRPKEDITRAQVAVMLWRFAGEESVSATSKFSDISSYSSSVQNAIIWEESAGVASGYKDGTFKPDDGCQRQHMAIFLYRFNSKVEQYKPLG